MKKISKSIIAFYILASYVLVLPLAAFVFSSGLLLNDDPGYWDKQAEAIVITCEDVTHRTKGEYENGGPSLSYEAEAVFDVDGKSYLVKTFGGINYNIGSRVVISYNSENPEKNYWGADPIAENLRMKKVLSVSSILLVLSVAGCILGIYKRKRKIYLHNK